MRLYEDIWVMVSIYLSVIDNDDDRAVFERLYNTQRKNLIGLSFKIIQDRQLAEDAVSEAFLRISKKFHILRNFTFEQLEIYCAVTVKNISINIAKSMSRELSEETENIHDDAFADEAMSCLDRAYLREKITRLNYNDNEILTLYYYYGLKLREISKIKNISAEAAKKRLQLARKHLKDLLQEDNYERK